MKKILSIFMLGFMLSVVSALQVNDVNIISPTTENFFNEDIIEIKWEWIEEMFGSVSSGNLQYATSCDGPWSSIFHSFGTEETSYEWDISELEEGEYCLFLTTNVADKNDKSGLFTIDNTDPTIIMSDISFYPDEKDNPVTIAFVHNDNTEVTSCKIDFGGMKTKNCLTGSERSYQFNNNGNYDVTITVKDAAGNEVSDTINVEVENVAPWGVAITTTQDVAASGEAVLFEATADDVEADKPLTYTWTFDDDEVVSELDNGDVTYTWASASIHIVNLCVSDGNDEICIEELYEIEIIDPTSLADQKVVAGEALDADFGDGTPKFPHGVIGGMCSLVPTDTPVGMVVEDKNSNTKCKVTWTTPTNEQRGINHVTIKVTKDDDYEYYSFDVTVYSWGIELVHGWNLISIPYMPVDTKINSVFGDIVENVAWEGTSTYTIFQYNAVSDEWSKAKKSSETGSTYTGPSGSKLTTIVPGYAYWIKMDAEDTIYGVEENFVIDIVPGQNGIDLVKGAWNLIGRFGVDSASLPWDIALKSLRFPTCNKNYVSDVLGIYGLESVTSNGETSWSKATQIEPAKGYWIRTAEKEVGSEDALIYEPDTI